MTHVFDDDGDDNDATKKHAEHEHMTEAGKYDLGDDVGERIGKDDSSDNSAL